MSTHSQPSPLSHAIELLKRSRYFLDSYWLQGDSQAGNHLVAINQFLAGNGVLGVDDFPLLSRTDWFPAAITPARPGVYETPEGYFRRWDGKKWRWGALTPALADNHNRPVPDCWWRPWRGLVGQP